MSSYATPSSRRPKMSGTLIGDFEIGGEIGKGSFATVYKGLHRDRKAIVAIKSVNLSKLNKKLKENLYSEIDILKSLKHPHIVALIDCKETTSHIHLVMEYCELGDLSYFIKKRDSLATNPVTASMTKKYPNPPAGGLNEVITRHFLKQLSSALEFLRVRNFIHRDVKPQNLLLNPSKKYLASISNAPLIMSVTEDSQIPTAGLDSLPMLKIADFGFARSLPATSLAETLCGSPLYMAPEILRYEKYDAKADLWSVGTVLYEMMVGRPPFRAANHVELLRKIEQGEDVIRFSKESEVSPSMKALIRGLLKRNPVERMSFEKFFSHDVVTEPIPGLVGEDRPTRTEETHLPTRHVAVKDVREATVNSDAQSGAQAPISSSPRDRLPRQSMGEDRAASVKPTAGTSPRNAMGRGHSSSNPPTVQQAMHRPSLQPAATEPSLVAVRRPEAGGVQMVRNASHETSSPGSSLLAGRANREPVRGDPTDRKIKLPPTPQELAAEDVRFEREYVVVEKRAVEVNAFADQMAAAPLLQPQNQQSPISPRAGPIVRRATTQGQPSSTTGAIPPQTSRAVQIAQGRPAPEQQHRTGSYERRYGGPSPTSTTSAISKAITSASLRLFGISYDKLSPHLLGKGASPPAFYNPFPSYPSPTNLALIQDGKSGNSLDEDAKTVLMVEDSATRSDVVYGFAEVKYKQLIPLAPSMDHGLGGALATKGEPEEEDYLTPDATVALSEEALVLYVKSLSLLAKSMDYASAWWASKNRGEVVASGSSPRNAQASVIQAGNRINGAVQWVRSRFNEVLEKAEFVRLKLIEAQKLLPEDHPGHPNNHTSASKLAGGSSTDGVVLSSGVTAEKLMYDRALEMSRSAAINEISNTDLQGCEISYLTAIRMLEAVLEHDEDTRKTGSPREEKEIRGEAGGIDLDDREAVQKVVTMVRQRLHALRKKMAIIARSQPSSLPQHLSRPSSTYGATPTITSTPPK